MEPISRSFPLHPIVLWNWKENLKGIVRKNGRYVASGDGILEGLKGNGSKTESEVAGRAFRSLTISFEC